MKQEEGVKIDKIVLNLEGEKISLSTTNAKKLYTLLEELFGKEKEIIKEHHYHNDWYKPWWPKPYYWITSASITGASYNYLANRGIVYCDDNASLQLSVGSTTNTEDIA